MQIQDIKSDFREMKARSEIQKFSHWNQKSSYRAGPDLQHNERSLSYAQTSQSEHRDPFNQRPAYMQAYAS